MTETLIVRPDGSKHKFERLKLQLHLRSLTKGLNDKQINIDSIINKIQTSIPEELTIDELIQLTAETLATLSTLHPDHSILGARVEAVALQNSIPSKFSDAVIKMYEYYNPKTKKHSPLVSEKLYEFVMQNSKKLNDLIDPSRDLDFTYFGIKTLQRSYLLKIDDKPVETPQFMLLRVSIGIHGEDLESIIETYELMSQRYFIHASPTLFNSGTPSAYLSSCFLLGITDDSIDGIYKTLHRCALISKAAGGIGIHVSNIRSEGSYIAGSNGTSNGIVPMLRVFNNTARYVDQGGNKRPGAFAIYLEPWHSDVFEFLNLRKNHGKEELRARDLFFALWIPDLFMEKVKSNEDWHLFSPDQAQGLNDVYGDEFNELYNKYVNEGLAVKTVKAQKLWSAILDAQTETGGPFMLYKDSCNRKSNQKNLGTIKSSNLCCEIVQYSSPEEVAVCNLGSLAVPSFVRFDDNNIWFDFVKLHEVTKILTKNLNRVIDVTDYPVEEAKYSNFKHRPIAIGVQGLSDLFMRLRLPFESDEAKVLNIQIFETIYHAALESSNELALKDGPYETFKDSPASQGILQFDLWNKKPSDLYDWSLLKTKIIESGLRNSLLVAPMPTASTSQILGFTESFEPLTSNIYSRRVLSGEFQLVNKYLVEDLIELGLWNEFMKNKIIDDDGSIQNIDLIPKEIKELYKTVWEISQKKIIDLAADRGAFIDQSQSMNIYLKEPTKGKLTSMHFYGWKKGLKTGMYYLRTQAASSAIKFTIDRTITPIEQQNKVNISNLKKRAYTELQSPIPVKKFAVLPTASESLTEESTPNSPTIIAKNGLIDQFSLVSPGSTHNEGDSYDIYSTTPLSCNISEPGNCESCSS